MAPLISEAPGAACPRITWTTQGIARVLANLACRQTLHVSQCFAVFVRQPNERWTTCE